MVLTVRQVVVGSIPTVVALLGFLWFRRKKKDSSICWENDTGSLPTEVQSVQRQLDVDSITTETVVPSVGQEEAGLLLESAAMSVSCDDTVSTQMDISHLESELSPQQSSNLGSCNRETVKSPVVHSDTPPLDDFSICNNLKNDVDWSEALEASIQPVNSNSIISTPPIVEEPVVTVTQAVLCNSAPHPPKLVEKQLPVIVVSDSPVEAGVVEQLSPPVKKGSVTKTLSGDQTTTESKPCKVTPAVEVIGDPSAGDYSHTNGLHMNGDSEEIAPPKDVTGGDHAGKSSSSEKTTSQPHSSSGSGDGDQASHSDITDAQSEVSSDSGRGASGIETPTATSPSELSDFVVYEFDFPSEFCGKLIGKNGKNINSVKAQTGAEIILKRKPFIRDYQNCCIEGTQAQVQAALENIRRRFPTKQYNNITYKQTNVVDETPMLAPEIMQLSLPVGVSVDCVVSSVVQANHIFVQQPTHPTFSSLESLNYYMNVCYTQDNVVPQLPRPIDPGVICAAPVFQGWYRAQVMAFCPETDDCDIKYVDYGGYMRVPATTLRQIRSDFATLPFQAVECYLANVMSLEDHEEMSLEASVMLESLVQGQMLQAQIMEHEVDGVPYIQLYNLSGAQPVFINRELVDRGVARWVETQG